MSDEVETNCGGHAFSQRVTIVYDRDPVTRYRSPHLDEVPGGFREGDKIIDVSRGFYLELEVVHAEATDRRRADGGTERAWTLSVRELYQPVRCACLSTTSSTGLVLGARNVPEILLIRSTNPPSLRVRLPMIE